MRLFEIRRRLYALLADAADGGASIRDISYETDLILCRYLKLSKAELLLYTEKEMSDEEADAILAIGKRRAAGEVLAYILGEVSFYGYMFAVGEGCLVPRSDTEIIVDWLIELLHSKDRFLDLCTGSGCIAIAALLEQKEVSAKAVDISDVALKYAHENRAKYHLEERLSIIKEDVFAPKEEAECFRVIVSNPPYIPTKDIASLDADVKREPRTALDGGADGMDFYRQIVRAYRENLTAGGCFLFEIGYDEEEKMRTLAKQAGMNIAFRRDFGGNIRAARLWE